MNRITYKLEMHCPRNPPKSAFLLKSGPYICTLNRYSKKYCSKLKMYIVQNPNMALTGTHDDELIYI